MEKTKLWLDLAIVIFGLLAAFSGILGFIMAKKIQAKNEIEKEGFKAQIAESTANAATAKLDAANASLETAATNERTRILEQETLIQRERAAVAEKELLTLKNKLAPRRISDHLERKIILALKKIPKKRVQLTCKLSNEESFIYATQFREIFEEAGWHIINGAIGQSTVADKGVHILTGTIYNDDLINEVKNVFQEHGLNLPKKLSSNKSNPKKVDLAFYIGIKD